MVVLSYIYYYLDGENKRIARLDEGREMHDTKQLFEKREHL